MIYKFKSKDAADVVMLGPNGDQLLRILGREPSARGIIEPADMPAAIATIEQAVVAQPPAVALRQRVWPFLEMLRECHRDGQPIVWGV